MNELLIDSLVQFFFGWPTIIASILISLGGVWLKKPVLLVAAGVICIPFTYYISGGFRSPAVVLPFLQFGSAYAVRREKNLIAWLLIAPLILVAVLLAYVVVTQ